MSDEFKVVWSNKSYSCTNSNKETKKKVTFYVRSNFSSLSLENVERLWYWMLPLRKT